MKRLLTMILILCGSWLFADLSLDFQGPDVVRKLGGKFLGAEFTEGPLNKGVTGANRAMVFGAPKGGLVFPGVQIPYQEGWVSFYCKRNRATPDTGFFFMDTLGTPNWYNRLFVMASLWENGEGQLHFGLLEAKADRSLKARIVMNVGDWHHVLVHWKNINSGNADGEAELYWDGMKLASVAGQRWNLTARGPDLYVGSVDQHSGHTNTAGDGAYAMDEFELRSGPVPEGYVQRRYQALARQERDYADGKPVTADPVKGGGEKQFLSIGFREFPYRQGAFFCRVKLNEILPEGQLMLFDSCGSPNWNDRIGMNMMMKGGNKVNLNFFVCGAPTDQYIHREVNKIVDWDVTKEHTILYQWKNVSSGKSDMELTCYFDGVNVASMTQGESFIKNPAYVVRVGGGMPTAYTPCKKDLMTITECRFWRRNLNTAEIAALSQDTSAPLQPQPVPFAAILQVKPLQLDGTPDGEFWNRAADIGWLHDFRREFVTVPYTVVKCGYDEKNLYVAWQAEYEGGQPEGQKYEGRDHGIWNNDSIEVIYAGQDGKLAHLVIDAFGGIYDELGGGKDWNSACQYAVTLKPKYWYGEVAIPLAEIQLKNGVIPVTFCRNMKACQTQTSCWSSRKFDELGELQMQPDAMTLLGNGLALRPVAGSNKGKLTVYSPKKQQEMVLSLTCVKDQERVVTRLLRTLDQGTQEIPFEYTVREGVNQYELVLQNSNGETFFSNTGRTVAEPPLKITTAGAFYLNKLRVNVDATAIDNVQPQGVVKVFSNNKLFIEKEISLKQGLGAAELDTSALAEDGIYQVEVSLQKGSGVTVKRREDFRYAGRPACINPDAGRKTYFGKDWFTPVFKDGVVKVWGRTYTWKDTLFPSSIVSRSDEMLQEAPYLEYRLNGKVCRLQKAKVTFVKGNDETTEFKAEAEDQALKATAKIWVDYDGHIGYDLDITPKIKGGITHLALVLPLHYRNAAYKLDGQETLYTPATRNVDQFPAEGKGFPLKNYVGIGGFDRALYFYTESDEGWLPYGREDTERITKRGDRVEWRLNILDGAPLTKLPTQRWGFMVTPYRDASQTGSMESYREISIWPGGVFRPDDVPYQVNHFDAYKESGKGNVVRLHMNWCKHTGGWEPDDAERLKNFVKEAHRKGFRVILYLSTLVNEFEPSFIHFGDYWVAHPTGSWFGRPWEPKTKYCSIIRCMAAPEYVDWFVGGCEYLMKEYDVDGFYYDFGIGTCNNAAHGCGYVGTQDAVKSGQSTETLGVNVGALSEADRNRRSTSLVRANREVWRRMYNLVKEYKGEQGIIHAHTMDPARVFTFPFMDVTVHSEFSACHGQGEWTSLDKYRLYYSRQDAGTMGNAILYNRNETAARQMLAVTLPHRELYAVGVGEYWSLPLWEKSTTIPLKLRDVFLQFDIDSAEWMPYYRNQELVEIRERTPLTNVSLWYKPEKLLVVVSNMTKADRDFVIQLKGKLAGYQTAEDAEDPKGAVTTDGTTLKVQVGKENFRLIELRK